MQLKKLSIQFGNGEMKLYLFAKAMLEYIENPKGSIGKLLDLIRKFDKIE